MVVTRDTFCVPFFLSIWITCAALMPFGVAVAMFNASPFVYSAMSFRSTNMDRTTRYPDRDRYFPLYDVSLFDNDDTECRNIVMLTDRELSFLKKSIGTHHVYGTYQRRWYVASKDSFYQGVEDEFFANEIMPFMARLMLKLEKETIMCTNSQLQLVVEKLGSIADSQASIKESMLAIVESKQSEKLSIDQLITLLEEGQEGKFRGALDLMLKIRELLGILPGFDIQFAPGELAALIMKFRYDRFMMLGVERIASALTTISVSQGGGELISLLDAVYEALPLTDSLDEFSSIPTETGDLLKALSAFFTTSQVDAQVDIAKAIRECCTESKGKSSVVDDILSPSEYSSVNGIGHDQFCQMLATALGRAVSFLDNLQYNVVNLIPSGATNKQRLDNAITSFYGNTVVFGGRGYDSLIDLIANVTEFTGFVATFKGAITSIMQGADCKGSPSDLMNLIQELMGLAYASRMGVFDMILPSSALVRVYDGSYEVVGVYVELYASDCDCDNAQSLYPIIEAYTSPNYNLLVAGRHYPSYTADIIYGKGYKVNFKVFDEFVITGNRVVSDEEGLFLSIGFNDGSVISSPPYPVYRVSVECGGLEVVVGNIEVQGYPSGVTVVPFFVPATGIPTIKVRLLDDIFEYYHYISDVWLTELQE